jgi:hypothetical protein
MPVSPLAAMYATEGQNNPALLTPDLMAAQPELQLAQGMMQQGVSTAPAYAAQALARALSGAIGAGLQKSVISDLAKATSGTAGRAADILEQEQPRNPAIGFLRSSDPYHQMLGLQMMQRVTPIQAELRALGPNQKMVAGNNTTLATGSPTLGGAAADAEARARAPFEPGGPATEQTPYGPREIELTAVERAAAAQRRAGGTSMPPAAIPQPQAQAPQQAPQSPAQQAQTPQAQAPQAPPVGAVMGKPIAHPEFEPAYPHKQR